MQILNAAKKKLKIFLKVKDLKAVNALGTVYSTQNYVKIPKRRKV